MLLRHLGYACINLSIKETTGHTFRLSNLSDASLEKTIRQNIQSLKNILQWNLQHGIHMFRIASSFIPFASHTNFSYNWQDVFKDELLEIKQFVQQNNIRLSMHPGQYTVLNSPNKNTLQTAIAEIEYSAQLINLLDPQQGIVVLHIGGMYGNKSTAINQFINNTDLLSETAKKHLALENDDKVFDLDDLLHICHAVKMPLIFDIFHHKCNYNGSSSQNGLADKMEQAMQTWNQKVPKLHISSQKTGTRSSHADYIAQNDFDELLYFAEKIISVAAFDVMIEAKQKEKAVLQLLHAQQFA